MLTCYSPVRRSSTPKGLSARLACVKHAASVRPEPGSNSPTKPMENKTPTIKENCREQKCIFWHWLIKHPVEFSRNKRPGPSLGPSGLATLARSGLSRQIGSIRLRRATPEHLTTRPDDRSESRSTKDSPADRPVHSRRRTWPGSRQQHQFTPAPTVIATAATGSRRPAQPSRGQTKPTGRRDAASNPYGMTLLTDTLI